MTLHEQQPSNKRGRPPGKRRPRLTEAQREAEREQRRHHRQQAEQRIPSGFLRVIPFNDWCVLRGFSVQTGRRLIADGKVRVTHLSARRIGIREDHDRAYLDACAREV